MRKYFILPAIAIILHSFFSMASAQAVIKDELYFYLSSNADNSYDRFYLRFADTYTDNYLTPEDGMKITTYYIDRPAAWTLQPDRNQALVLNGLRMVDNRTLIVGYSVPAAGYYTFRMDVNTRSDLRTIILIDSVENKRIDLLQTGTYTFYTDAIRDNNSRFSFFINYRVKEDLYVNVSGNVVISGSMRSDVPVHVYADEVDAGKVDIDNTDANTVLMADTIILYSNNTSDGLLRNLNTSGGGVSGTETANPKQVIVRKNFTETEWTYLSLPFDVDSANVMLNGVTLFGGKETPGYWAYGWDNVARADLANPSSQKIWKQITYKNGFSKGAGYQFWYDNEGAGGNVDFVTTKAADINNLFSTEDQDLPFSKYATTVPWDNPNLSNGWALIGGLHSTTFTAGKASVNNYKGVIYYREAKTSQATGNLTTNRFFECVLTCGESADLAPYVPFYIQETTDLTPGSLTMGTFTFKTIQGLSIESAEYRSSQDENPETTDQFKFLLSSNKNSTYDRFYLGFDENYSESYRTPEDAMKLSISHTEAPSVWSLSDENNQPLVLNGLPLTDGRNVRVGFSVPEAGNYTFTAETLRRENVKNILLIDNNTGKKIDMLQFPYSFNTEAVNNENSRFTLLINSSYTDIPSIESGMPHACIKDHLLTVKNLTDGNIVQVYDLAGRMITSGQATGKEFSTVLGQKGVFVVNVKGEKAAVLKVLNK